MAQPKSSSNCVQKVLGLWVCLLLVLLVYAHQAFLPQQSEQVSSSSGSRQSLPTEEKAERKDRGDGLSTNSKSLEQRQRGHPQGSEPSPQEALGALGIFENNSPRPPPRAGDYEEYSEAPDTLPGIDANHLHGLIGLKADGSPMVRPTPLPPGGLSDEDRRDAHRGFCFNSRVSDSLPLDRQQRDFRSPACQRKAEGYPKDLPPATVVIVFHNEAFSVLIRSVHSVLNTSPPRLLKEIILVDDASHPDDLRFYRKHWARLQDELSNYVKVLPKTRLVRLKERRGLMLARMEGVWRSTAEVTIFLDSHIEATKGWLEPILSRIKEDKCHVVVPSIDTIGADDLEYRLGGGLGVLGFSWTLGQDPYQADTGHDGTVPAKSPVMAGGLFASDTREFLRLGGYDPEMRLYGGEEMEIGFRTWMCGGDIEYLPCSHVGHIFRTPQYWQGQVYKVPGEEINRNKLRTAEVWMDEFQSLVKFASGPLPASLPIGDLEPRKQLRKKLNCKDFRWYLQVVTPNLFVPNITAETKGGALRNQVLDACLDTLGSKFPGEAIGAYPCHGQHGTQAFVEDKSGLMRVPQLGYKMCLSHEGNAVAVRPCKDSDSRLHWLLDDMHLKSSAGKCMQVTDAHNDKSPFTLTVAECSELASQEWHWS